MFRREYCFIENTGGTFLSSTDLFAAAKEAGFLGFEGKERSADRFTGTGGFNPAEKGGGGANPALRQSPYGVELSGRGYPLRFRVRVPHKGVYKITVTIHGGNSGVAGLQLFTGRRNLVKRDVNIAAGDIFTCSFYCHVCEYIPVIGKPAMLDCSVYAGVLGAPARLSAVTAEEASAPTLFLAGDSLVTDYDGLYPYNPLLNGGSWGQNLLPYFSRAAVNNQAHGGMTANCFRTDGHWDIVDANIRSGDIFMMEFGHNDQKRRNLKAFDQYASHLRWYIRQVRKRGAYPVIVTPLSRIPAKDEDGFYDLLEDYAESCRRVGRECKVPVIDLHRNSFRWLCGIGTETAGYYFMDTTHTNDYGALLMADYIAAEIRRQQIAPLYHQIEQMQAILPPPDLSLRPEGLIAGGEKEERPILPVDLPELPYEDCRGIAREDILKKAMAKGLLDPCVKYFHPFDGMPRGQFLYILSKAAGMPGNRPYLGRYCDIYRYEFDAKLVQAALDAALIDEQTTPDDRFRPDDNLTEGELVSFVVRAMQRPGKRNLSIARCETIADEKGLLWAGYRRERPGTRLQCVAALLWLMEQAGR